MDLSLEEEQLKVQVRILQTKLDELSLKIINYETTILQLEKHSKVALWVCAFVVVIAITSVFGVTFMRLAYHLTTGK